MSNFDEGFISVPWVLSGRLWCAGRFVAYFLA
jgi:hypothetical protein